MLKTPKGLSNIKDLDNYFKNLPPLFLSVEEAVVYILHTLDKGDTYGIELRRYLEGTEYNISQTILYAALKFLLKENLIETYLKPKEKNYKGRPPIFYRLTYKNIKNIKERNVLKTTTLKLKDYWNFYIN